VRLLLDTHCWLWMQVSPDRFRSAALDLVRNPESDLLFSAASAWEIAIKYTLGKLQLPEPPEDYVPKRMRTSGVVGLPVGHAHALRVAELPKHHRDPFDRLLVAQAQIESLALLTADPKLTLYEVEIVSA
jgi:PIN domain nuclease of toxin-antitoxin system